jgi:CubicO group peptidase (beta-lactamase class C family)
MLRLIVFFCAMNGLVFGAHVASAAEINANKLKEIDTIVEAAIQRGDCPGAVVGVVHDDKMVYRKAFGNRALKPKEIAMTTDTIFDLASLTKPIATATSILLLIEKGKLKPDDLVSQHWPEFKSNGKDKVTIEHLLLHTSGLTADNAIGDYAEGKAKAMERIAGLKLEAAPGTRFQYSDVGYIVLGELIERIGGMPIDQFAKKHIFDPLKMRDTGFTPPESLKPRIAPTGLRSGKIILGEVHDPRAYKLDSIAGHAGLFSTVDDLACYCRMLLRGGELDETRILEAKTVKAFTAPHAVPLLAKDKTTTKGLRSWGWDVDTPYSGQRGDLFLRGEGYGHTGFTGTSIWIDPSTKTAIILLTNRVHPEDKGNVSRLRRELGTIVAAAVGK